MSITVTSSLFLINLQDYSSPTSVFARDRQQKCADFYEKLGYGKTTSC